MTEQFISNALEGRPDGYMLGTISVDKNVLSFSWPQYTKEPRKCVIGLYDTNKKATRMVLPTIYREENGLCIVTASITEEMTKEFAKDSEFSYLRVAIALSESDQTFLYKYIRDEAHTPDICKNTADLSAPFGMEGAEKVFVGYYSKKGIYGIRFIDMSGFCPHITAIDKDSEQIVIQGYVEALPDMNPNLVQVKAVINKTNVMASTICRDGGIDFCIVLPTISDSTTIRIQTGYGDCFFADQKPGFSDICPVSDETMYGYYYTDNLIFQVKRNCLICSPCETQQLHYREELIRNEILTDEEMDITAKTTCIFLRDFAFLYRYGYEKNIYDDLMKRCNALQVYSDDELATILDRFTGTSAADQDNTGCIWFFQCAKSELQDAFSQYLLHTAPDQVHIYYLKAEKVSDEGMSESPNTVSKMSLSYKVLYLLSDYIFTAGARQSEKNPFSNREGIYLRDICVNTKHINYHIF